jgi:hypothetical protein
MALELSRAMMALAIFAIGLWAFISPGCFWGITQYFKWSSRKLSPLERDRLERTVVARENAEGVSGAYGRWLGVFGMAVAAVAFIPAVPSVVPYAAFCLALAALMLLGYLQFRRATERRVAPLLRRSVMRALPVGSIAAVLCTFVATLALAIYPDLRLGAIAGALATLVLGVIAWRIATAPALLLGMDPQVEYAVDEYVRAARATSIAWLACAPAFVFVTISSASLSRHGNTSAGFAVLIVSVAFVVGAIENALLLRRRIQVA